MSPCFEDKTLRVRGLRHYLSLHEVVDVAMRWVGNGTHDGRKAEEARYKYQQMDVDATDESMLALATNDGKDCVTEAGITVVASKRALNLRGSPPLVHILV
jgi:hypothetical protein